MGTRFLWGILGPGQIAHSFAEAIKQIPNAEIRACASHSIEKANAFADEFGIPDRYSDYSALLADKDISCVYISTTNPYHFDAIIQALNAGKNVMCEKPMCLNERQTALAIELAKKKNLFLMEAMWSRFLPIYKEVDKWIDEGQIGELKHIECDFAFTAPFPPNDRHIDPANGGGAMLDIGIYSFALIQKYLGSKYKMLKSVHEPYASGVDNRSVVSFSFPNGRTAVATTAFDIYIPQCARLFGESGYITINDFWHGTKATLTHFERPFAPPAITEAEAAFEGNGYQYELISAMECIKAGLKENPAMPLEHTLATAKLMNSLRREWGICFKDNIGEE